MAILKQLSEVELADELSHVAQRVEDAIPDDYEGQLLIKVVQLMREASERLGLRGKDLLRNTGDSVTLTQTYTAEQLDEITHDR